MSAHTELLVQVDEHNHSKDADMNSGKLWAPIVETAAQEWMEAASKPHRRDLQQYLVGMGFTNLPEIDRIGSWLARYNTRKKATQKSKGQAEKPPDSGFFNFAETKALEHWKHPERVTPTTLRIRIPPTPTMKGRLCICHSCEKMFSAATEISRCTSE